MSFKIAKRYREAAAAINVVPVDKFPRLLGRVFQKLHIKGERLFSAAEEDQLKTLFGLSSEELELIMDGCCYTFEQAAFTLTGPEALYVTLHPFIPTNTHSFLSCLATPYVWRCPNCFCIPVVCLIS